MEEEEWRAMNTPFLGLILLSGVAISACFDLAPNFPVVYASAAKRRGSSQGGRYTTAPAVAQVASRQWG